MPKVATPVLGPAGWVTEPNGILTRMFMLFVANDYSQSNQYQGNVISLPWIINNNQTDLVAIQTLVRSQLSSWLDRHFSDNEIEVTVRDNEDESTVTLTINVEVTFEGKKYSAGRALQYNTDSLVIDFVNELSENDDG